MLDKVFVELAVGIVLLAGAYWWGDHNASNACIAGQSKGMQVAQKVADKESDRKEAVGAAREVTRETIRVVYRTIKGEAVKNVEKNTDAYAACGLDADGLLLWNAANSGRAAPLSGEPDSTVSNAAASAVGEAGGFAGEPHRDDGAGSAVPGSIKKIGGM